MAAPITGLQQRAGELLHHSAELAHVVRPAAAASRGQRLRRAAEGGTIGVTTGVVQRLTGQRGDVPPGAQRRRGDDGRVEAVEEIPRENAPLAVTQILMAGADDPHRVP